MQSKKNVTIYDIAREAHVSPATVSRILTGNTAVRKEKRDAVNALIEKYNFRPNAMARALTETRSRTLGMICADTSNTYYTSVFTACQIAAYARGYSLVLYNTMSRPELEKAALERLLEQRVDAIIISGGRIDLAESDPDFIALLDLVLKSIPIVSVSKIAHPKLYCVAVNHEHSVDVALDYLLSLGHRDIAFMYAGTQFYGTQEKLRRFALDMENAGIHVTDDMLIPVPKYDSLSGRAGIEQLLARKFRPTALIGMNDMVSAGALQGLLDHGIRVPEDISLIGFDDTFITTLTSPQLAAVDYDYQDFGEAIVAAAFCAIDGTRPPYTLLIEPTLSKKRSCAPPFQSCNISA